MYACFTAVLHVIMLTTVYCCVFIIKFNAWSITFCFLFLSPCLLLVLPSVKQLPAATQAAANWHSSSEQPGGALPLAELLDPREIQVSSPMCGHSICGFIADPERTPALTLYLCLFFSLQQPGRVSGGVCRHCQRGPDQEAPWHAGTTYAQEAEGWCFQTHAFKDGAHCSSGAEPHAEVNDDVMQYILTVVKV